MSTDPAAQSGLLHHLGVLRFVGVDSASFLQGQVSNDTRRLGQGQSLLAAYSSSQGRVLALMHLLPHSSGIVAILPRELLQPTLSELRKYVLRAKVRIEEPGEALRVAGHHGAAALSAAGMAVTGAGYAEQQEVGVAAVGADPTRYWVIGTADALAQRGLAGEAEQTGPREQAWRLADVRAGLPQIYLPTREAFIAQMLNLDLLDGISFSKGCYTGQEIIARTQHLGRIKRRMFRLGLPPGNWAIGQAVRLADGRMGRLCELARDAAGIEALAVLTLQAGVEAGPEVGADAAVAAAELPLPYPLSGAAPG